MSNFRIKNQIGKCFSVKLLGEGSIDAGGPFRDTLTNIAQELESDLLPLLIKTPNNIHITGGNRECFMLNPHATSPA